MKNCGKILLFFLSYVRILRSRQILPKILDVVSIFSGCYDLHAHDKRATRDRNDLIVTRCTRVKSYSNLYAFMTLSI